MGDNSKRAIVVGASSGIGRALAKVLAEDGYELGLAARRVEFLAELQKELPARSVIKRIDVAELPRAIGLLEELIRELGGMDLIVLNAGVNLHNQQLDWPREEETIRINALGFTAMANAAVQYFWRQKSGHLVGISSIAGLRGSASGPSYSASKAFVSNYLEGLRHRLREDNIYVTDIRPGFVDTEMVKDSPCLFWLAAPEAAAKQMLWAIKKKAGIAYITRRWRIMAWAIKLMPDWVYSFRFKLEKKKR